MKGVQLVGVIPQEMGPAPLPQIPRPNGLFDQISFANGTPVDVTSVDVTLSRPGIPSYAASLGPVAAGTVAVATLNVNQGQFHYLAMEVHLANGTSLTMPPFEIHQSTDWYLGRVMSGVAADTGGGVQLPYCVMTLFPDDLSSQEIYAQAVPYDAWT